jgi:hypothetical protein
MAAKEVTFPIVPRRGSPEALDAFVQGAPPASRPLTQTPPLPTPAEQPVVAAPPPAPAPIARAPAKATLPMKRLTFDIPADLHMRMKLACVREGVDMAEVLRELIARRFP